MLIFFLVVWIGFRQPEPAPLDPPVSEAPRFSLRSAASVTLWCALGLSLVFSHEGGMAMIILVLGMILDLTKPHIAFEAVLLFAATLFVNSIAMALLHYAPVNWVALVAGVSAALALFGTDRGRGNLHPRSLLWFCHRRLRHRKEASASRRGAPRVA